MVEAATATEKGLTLHNVRMAKRSESQGTHNVPYNRHSVSSAPAGRRSMA